MPHRVVERWYLFVTVFAATALMVIVGGVWTNIRINQVSLQRAQGLCTVMETQLRVYEEQVDKLTDVGLQMQKDIKALYIEYRCAEVKQGN
jgi:hypothetical protein